ncbi:MAG: hypothetical protein ACM3RX_08735 [Methanococcaceae archaeon]
MKRVIVYTLLAAMLLNIAGCSSFLPLEKEEKIDDYLHSSQTHIEFILKNGEDIKTFSRNCSYVDSPGRHIYGDGILINKITQYEEAFSGEVIMDLVDSLKNITADLKNYIFCYLKNSKRIIFEEKDVVIVNSDTLNTFWVIHTSPPKIIFTSDIKDIQVEKFNTAQIITGVAIGAGILAALIVLFINLEKLRNIGSGWK